MTPPRVLSIVEEEATRHNVLAGDILDHRRMPAVVQARYSAVKRISALLGASSTQIGRWLNCDHSTVLKGLKT
jgi:chromosomal replication initiation ATPase DnaA